MILLILLILLIREKHGSSAGDQSDALTGIGFKAGFLIDILNNTPGQEIVFQLADPSRAGVVVPAQQEENESLLMLLMPMVLND